MKNELKSEGYCLFCGQVFPKQELGKHLAAHLAKLEKEDKDKTTSNYCHVLVEEGDMFLHLLIKGDQKMKAIDNYLRKIWLECCGHMSDFGHKNFRVAMSHAVEDVLEPRIKIYHDYDFGSTTRVFLKGLKHYQLHRKDKILLLSRNEPLKIMCSTCEKEPAVDMCIDCFDDYDYLYFCEKCAEVHEEECDGFVDYARMPVVNSPRMGICGYGGGSIDLERDGPYRKV